MCDMSAAGSTVLNGLKNFADPSGLPMAQRALVSVGKGALGGFAQNQQQRMGLPATQMGQQQTPWWKNKKTTGASSPVGQPASTQAPQGSSTNDDMPNQMPNFGTRPQQGGFGDEDFLRRYFSGGMSGSQGFNA